MKERESRRAKGAAERALRVRKEEGEARQTKREQAGESRGCGDVTE